MSLQTLCMVLIAAACSWGVYRTLALAPRWRWLLVVAQLLSALLLALALFPPSTVQAPQSLRVLTPGVDAKQLEGLDPDRTTLALPGVAVKHAWILRAPDLATALRRLPRVNTLQILGDGLPARDRDAVGDRALGFEPSPAPAGIVEMHFPAAVDQGLAWSISGRAEGVPSARVELQDRAGARTATAAVDGQGHFQLDTVSRVSGEELWQLRLLDATEQLIEQVPLALRVRGPGKLHGLFLAGAPDAELKYLRRWALDAGHGFESQLQLSRGIEQRGQVMNLDAAHLAEQDLVVVDERAWAGLSAREKGAIDDAVNAGMGLLMRISGSPSTALIDEWRERGLPLQPMTSAEVSANAEATGATEVSIGHDRPALTISGEDLVPLLTDVDGSPLAAWRAYGQGRMGIWLPRDSYRLQLAGQGSRYGSLWSQVFSTLGRARGVASPQLPQWARVGELSRLCAMQEPAEIVGPSGETAKLRVDAKGAKCADWWPQADGWHTVRDGAGQWPVFVYSPDQAQALFRAQRREATQQMVRADAPSWMAATAMPRWPWFLAWLLVSASLWWLQRRRPAAN